MFRMSAVYRIPFWQMILVVILSIFLMGLDGYLFLQNYYLRNTVGRKTAISVGMTLLPFEGLDSEGQHYRLEPQPGQKTLLLVFSPACKFCRQNAPGWSQIIAAAPFRDSRLVGVSLGRSGDDFIKDYGWNGQLTFLNLLGDTLQNGPHFDATPMTILLDEGGRAEKVWRGVLSATLVAEILTEL